MQFKQYLAEAEWVAGKRHPTIEALWHVLQPLQASNSHLLSLGPLPVDKEPRKLLNPSGGEDIPKERGSRAYSPDSIAVGIPTFMKEGTGAFDRDSWYDSDRVVLHILKVNPRQVWTIDPNFNQRNPWIILQTHWKDLQREYERLIKIKNLSLSVKVSVVENWGNIANNLESVYRRSEIFNHIGHGAESKKYIENDLTRLQYLFHQVYVEAPRLLKFLKSGESYGTRSHSGSQFRSLGMGQSPQSYDMHFPTGMRFEFKVLTDTMPLSKATWAVIVDPSAVKTVNTVVIPASFKGFKGTKDNLGYYPPDARGEAAQRVEDEAVEFFQEQILDMLNDFLELVEEVVADVIYGENHIDWSRTPQRLNKEIKILNQLLSKLKAINPSLGVPDIIKDAIQQFESQGDNLIMQLQHSLAEVEDKVNSDEEDGDSEDDLRRAQTKVDEIGEAFSYILAELKGVR